MSDRDRYIIGPLHEDDDRDAYRDYETETESMAAMLMDVASKRDYYVDLLPERIHR